MEVLLRIGGLCSFCIPDLPDRAFLRKSPETHSTVCELFDLEKAAVLIGVFMDPFRPRFFSDLASSVSSPVVFFVFAGCKNGAALENQLKQMNTSSVRFIFVPRQYDVYPSVLASCHLGICWNGSPGVMNIAMEILEMEACGIPIAAFRFGCVSERVRPDANGLLFDTDHQLKEIILRVISESGATTNYPQTDLRQDWECRWREAFAQILGVSFG
jgi:glycosyltransferase involved in cell wall biosynthesis